jgi:Mn-dependent DtxR family transcriptional regulator
MVVMAITPFLKGPRSVEETASYLKVSPRIAELQLQEWVHTGWIAPDGSGNYAITDSGRRSLPGS